MQREPCCPYHNLRAPPLLIAGEWQDDVKHGQGTSRYPSGNCYTGSWVADKQEGFGTIAWQDRGQTYTGQWAAGLPNGLGEHVWLQQGAGSTTADRHGVHVMHNRWVLNWSMGQCCAAGMPQHSAGLLI